MISMKKIIISALIFLSYCGIAYAQIGPGQSCTASNPCFVSISGGGGITIGTVNQGTQAATATGSTWFFQEPLVQSAPGTPQTMALTIQGNASGIAVPVSLTSGSSTITTKPGTYTEVALDISTTTSANTAVNALSATHRSAGGWIENPITATTVICVNTITTAAFSSGACVGSNNGVAPGQVFNIPANANAVSVVSSDASHAFSGEGLQ